MLTGPGGRTGGTENTGPQGRTGSTGSDGRTGSTGICHALQCLP